MKKKYRSALAYGKKDRDGFIHRSWMKSQGLPDHAFDGRPIIGLCNTWSELTTCNVHLRELAEYVKRGVWEAGGVPVEFPVMSLGETQMKPTAMLYRNLLAMDVEESIRGNPIDGVVLLGGCDKTTPGQMMGAASRDLPSIVLSSGPMLNGRHRGKAIGSGTDVWRLSEAMRAGEISEEEFFAAESGMSRSSGTCMTMGSASSFACLTEALGCSLPYNGTLPAVDSRRKVLAHLTGTEIVRLVETDTKLSHFLTRESFENAIIALAALGGSTNSVIHLLALAGRCDIKLDLEDFDTLTKKIPLLVNLQPSGNFLMEDFHYAGGMPVVLNRLKEHLNLDTPCVNNKTLVEVAKTGECFNDEVIAPFEKPIKEEAGFWVLKGNLCPNGALIKPSAASKSLFNHTGPAVVFESIEDFRARIDSPDLEVTKDSIMVLKGCGPKGYPGMPEVGNMPIPRKMIELGVKDMLRISDARMSGTAYGTVVLHISPEAADNGPLAVVKNGDMIEFNANNRSLNLLISKEELQTRQQLQDKNILKVPKRGYPKLYVEHVLQAEEGCDFDFLQGKSTDEITRESH